MKMTKANIFPFKKLAEIFERFAPSRVFPCVVSTVLVKQ
jgi:hypothetical protein